MSLSGPVPGVGPLTLRTHHVTSIAAIGMNIRVCGRCGVSAMAEVSGIPRLLSAVTSRVNHIVRLTCVVVNAIVCGINVKPRIMDLRILV